MNKDFVFEPTLRLPFRQLLFDGERFCFSVGSNSDTQIHSVPEKRVKLNLFIVITFKPEKMI